MGLISSEYKIKNGLYIQELLDAMGASLAIIWLSLRFRARLPGS